MRKLLLPLLLCLLLSLSACTQDPLAPMVYSGQPVDIPVPAVDTTAAGDLWAAGFLYGLFTGRSLDDAAHFGAVTSGEVVKVIGSEMDADTWEYIRKRIQYIICRCFD